MKQMILAATFLMASTAMVAQPHGRPDGEKAQQIKERIETAQIAFLTKELELTPEEAQVFWPVYNAYQAELKSIREKYKNNRSDMSLDAIDKMSDKEAIKAMQEIRAQMEATHKVKETYHKKFLEVLSPKKVLKLYAAEREFKQHVLQRMRHQEQERSGRGGRGQGRPGHQGRGGHGPQHGGMGGHPDFMF